MVPVNFQGNLMKCWGRLPVIGPVSHCLTYNSMVKELKSILESSYPSSWSSSLFSQHEATRSIATPSSPEQDAHVLQGYPQAFQKASLTICQYPLILPARKRHSENKVFCSRTKHINLTRFKPGPFKMQSNAPCIRSQHRTSNLFGFDC